MNDCEGRCSVPSSLISPGPLQQGSSVGSSASSSATTAGVGAACSAGSGGSSISVVIVQSGKFCFGWSLYVCTRGEALICLRVEISTFVC